MKLTSRLIQSRSRLLDHFEKFYGIALRIGDNRPPKLTFPPSLSRPDGKFGRGYAFVNKEHISAEEADKVNVEILRRW